MKKLTLIIISILIATSIFSQITDEQMDKFEHVGYEWNRIRVQDSLMTEFVLLKNDSIIYEYDEFPNEFIDNQYNDVDLLVGDTLYEFTGDLRAYLTYARRIVVYQRVHKYVKKPKERTRDEKMNLYLKKAKKENVKNSNFIKHNLVVAILPKDSDTPQ